MNGSISWMKDEDGQIAVWEGPIRPMGVKRFDNLVDAWDYARGLLIKSFIVEDKKK